MLTKRSRWEVNSQGHRGRKNPQFWSGIEEMPYCLSRSSLQLQSHMDKTIANLTPTLTFPDDNSSWIYRWLGNDAQTLNGAYRRSPIFFRGHLPNFKVIGAKKLPIWPRLWRLRLLGRSQLSDPSDFLSPVKCCIEAITRIGFLTPLAVHVQCYHDDVIKWKHFPHYWPFVRGIHRSPVNSPHKGPWRGALMFTLICARINGWVNNREAGDLRRYCAHYDVIVMIVDWI